MFVGRVPRKDASPLTPAVCPRGGPTSAARGRAEPDMVAKCGRNMNTNASQRGTPVRTEAAVIVST